MNLNKLACIIFPPFFFLLCGCVVSRLVKYDALHLNDFGCMKVEGDFIVVMIMILSTRDGIY